MASVTIGLRGTSDPGNSTLLPSGGASAFALDPALYGYTVTQPVRITTVGILYVQPLAPRPYKIALYEADGDVATDIGGGGAFVSAEDTIPIGDGSTWDYREIAVDWLLESGKQYILAAMQNGGGNLTVGSDGGTTGDRDNLAPTYTFADPFDKAVAVIPSIYVWATGATVARQQVVGGVGDPQTTPARGNSGDVAITNIGGVSSSIIGVCPNESNVEEQSDGLKSIYTELSGGNRPTTQTANHAFKYIGGGASTANETGSPSEPDTPVTHEAQIYDAETETYGGKGVRHVLADADAASGAAVSPSTFLNQTSPPEEVKNGEGVVAVEP